jgi:hypothetical protein
MSSSVRLLLVVAGAVGLLAFAAAPASGYGKATWQTAFNGTFNFPGTGTALGFWGWCDFAGGISSGTDADCQIAEYFHAPAGTGWTCQLTIAGTSWYANGVTGTFHMTGSLGVHGHLTSDQQAQCVSFFTGDPSGSTSFSDVETFIPTAPGHYAIPPSAVFGPDVVGEFHFQVNLNPTA